jgi:hypothetical protein
MRGRITAFGDFSACTSICFRFRAERLKKRSDGAASSYFAAATSSSSASTPGASMVLFSPAPLLRLLPLVPPCGGRRET